MGAKKFYFLNMDLSIKHTGVESSALLRSRLFINQLNITPVFITIKYRSQATVEVEGLRNQKKLAPDVQVVNMYDYFQSFKVQKEGSLFIYGGELVVPLSGLQRLTFFDSDRKQRASVFYNQNNQRLHYIIHFHQGRRWRRDYYHETGNLSCTHLFDNEGKELEQEIFYRANGTICLIKSYSRQAEQKQPSVIIQVVDAYGQIMKVMDNEDDLVAYFLQQYFVDKQEKSILLVDRNRFFYDQAISLKKRYGSDRIRVISAIHNLHIVNYRQKESSRVNSNYVSVFKDLSQADAVVVQTNIQRQDILQRFGERSNIYAIPHTYERPLDCTIGKNRSPFKAVYFARYAQDKRHEFAFEAFKKVVEKLPQAEFHCYGTGSRLGELQGLVKKLEMTQHIFLHGWCEDVTEEYESAALSIISSPSESFSLTIAESLAHGCPVVGFNVPYGPQELIQPGVNGYLVPFKATDEMAERVLEIMTDPTLQQVLSENARESSKRFSESRVKELWQILLQTICSEPKHLITH